jgi:AraC-like DNA-binding protein
MRRTRRDPCAAVRDSFAIVHIAADPLSGVLALLEPTGSFTAGLDAGGEWAVRFPPHEGIKFLAVIHGACWASVDADPHPVHVEAGALPAIVHVREASTQASVLRWAIGQLRTELRDRQPGGALVSAHLAHIMIVQVLRLYLGSQRLNGTGWLAALTDHQIGTAVSAMHADPARRWTIEDLGRLAGMSRSAFAHRFKQVVGTSPLGYLARRRMLIAAERLRGTGDTVAMIAQALGYESAGAFSTAFKKIMGCSPKQYRAQPLHMTVGSEDS